MNSIDPQDYPFDPSRYSHPPLKAVHTFTNAVRTLIDVQLPVLQLPVEALPAFEPSQIGTIAGKLMDACLPQLDVITKDALIDHGLTKAPGLLGEREGYPDYEHASTGLRAELKLLYVDPPEGLVLKKPPTRREPSARLTQKVTLKNVRPERDLLMVLAYQLRRRKDDPELTSLTIIDVGVFPVIDCVLARDRRLIEQGGRWYGDFETPVVLSKIGADKLSRGEAPDITAYGRKSSEGRDFNEDTNFGKLKRIPHPPLQMFLRQQVERAAL